MINFIEYKNLPSNFWDKVIYYEYFVSFSGFVKDEPFVFTCDFQIKERSDYIAEDEFMSCFKKTFKCDIGNHENGVNFDNPIKGYHLFKQKNVFWIRDDLCQNNYKNVIEPFIHNSGNKRFLQSIICGCVENKNLDKEEKE